MSNELMTKCKIPRHAFTKLKNKRTKSISYLAVAQHEITCYLPSSNKWKWQSFPVNYLHRYNQKEKC